MSLSDSDLNIEEADVQLVPHAIHATQAGAKRLVILSGRTCHGSDTLLKYFLNYNSYPLGTKNTPNN